MSRCFLRDVTANIALAGDAFDWRGGYAAPVTAGWLKQHAVRARLGAVESVR